MDMTTITNEDIAFMKNKISRLYAENERLRNTLSWIRIFAINDGRDIKRPLYLIDVIIKCCNSVLDERKSNK